MQQQTDPVSLKKMRWNLLLLSIFKIPLIGFVRPKLLVINQKEVVVRIKLRRRTKNHLNSMYFGALAIGADVAGGIQAFYFAEILKVKMSFAFKSMNAEFIQRPETDVIFTCSDGELIKKSMEQSISSGERVNKMVIVEAKDLNGVLVAKFNLEVSVKAK